MAVGDFKDATERSANIVFRDLSQLHNRTRFNVSDKLVNDVVAVVKED
jgi:hypothetical protein